MIDMFITFCLVGFCVVILAVLLFGKQKPDTELWTPMPFTAMNPPESSCLSCECECNTEHDVPPINDPGAITYKTEQEARMNHPGPGYELIPMGIGTTEVLGYFWQKQAEDPMVSLEKRIQTLEDKISNVTLP